MSYKTKLKIGEFSQMMQVTVKTLRHYEQKGLLIPDEVDEWTGYRYYTVEQMQRLNNIRELQQLGFSLDEIGMLYEDDSHAPTIGQLSRKIRDTEQQLRMLIDQREKLLPYSRQAPLLIHRRHLESGEPRTMALHHPSACGEGVVKTYCSYHFIAKKTVADVS